MNLLCSREWLSHSRCTSEKDISVSDLFRFVWKCTEPLQQNILLEIKVGLYAVFEIKLMASLLFSVCRHHVHIVLLTAMTSVKSCYMFSDCIQKVHCLSLASQWEGKWNGLCVLFAVFQERIHAVPFLLCGGWLTDTVRLLQDLCRNTWESSQCIWSDIIVESDFSVVFIQTMTRVRCLPAWFCRTIVTITQYIATVPNYGYESYQWWLIIPNPNNWCVLSEIGWLIYDHFCHLFCRMISTHFFGHYCRQHAESKATRSPSEPPQCLAECNVVGGMGVSVCWNPVVACESLESTVLNRALNRRICGNLHRLVRRYSQMDWIFL